MAAPLENQFWKQRSKHGRDKLFATPHLLWQAAEQYFQMCDENPWQRHDFVGKDADEVWRKTARPYTLSGFCLYASAIETHVAGGIQKIVFSSKIQDPAQCGGDMIALPPGNWQIICTTKECTETIAAKIVEKDGAFFKCYAGNRSHISHRSSK